MSSRPLRAFFLSSPRSVLNPLAIRAARARYSRDNKHTHGVPFLIIVLAYNIFVRFNTALDHSTLLVVCATGKPSPLLRVPRSIAVLLCECIMTDLLISSDRPLSVCPPTGGRFLVSKKPSPNAGSCTAPTRLEGVGLSTSPHHRHRPHRCLRYRRTKPHCGETPPRNSSRLSWLGFRCPRKTTPPLPGLSGVLVNLRLGRGVAMLVVMLARAFLALKPKRARHRCRHWHQRHHRLRRGWAAEGNMC